MTKPTACSETTILGYGASEPSRDLITAARQRITRDWLASAARRYRLFVSQPVVRDYDMRRIMKDFQEQERTSTRKVVTRQCRAPVPVPQRTSANR